MTSAGSPTPLRIMECPVCHRTWAITCTCVKSSSAKLSLTWSEGFLLPPRLRLNCGNQSSGGLKKNQHQHARQLRSESTKRENWLTCLERLSLLQSRSYLRDKKKEKKRVREVCVGGGGVKASAAKTEGDAFEKHTSHFWAESRERLSRSEVDSWLHLQIMPPWFLFFFFFVYFSCWSNFRL